MKTRESILRTRIKKKMVEDIIKENGIDFHLSGLRNYRAYAFYIDIHVDKLVKMHILIEDYLKSLEL